MLLNVGTKTGRTWPANGIAFAAKREEVRHKPIDGNATSQSSNCKLQRCLQVSAKGSIKHTTSSSSLSLLRRWHSLLRVVFPIMSQQVVVSVVRGRTPSTIESLGAMRRLNMPGMVALAYIKSVALECRSAPTDLTTIKLKCFF